MFETSLPGSSIQVIDEYNKSVYDTSQFGTTESVLVIGTAFDGPSGKEVVVYNPEHAAYIFGGTYDSRARRSASLVAQIQDAYDKGCRTIYAMRVGGKEISKTYRLKEDLPIYFRVSGVFPSNKYKDMAIAIHDGKFEIYKTANKATIEEKREGVVESTESIIKVSVDINDSYGYDKDSKLSDFIQFINTYIKNNVFHFALVDEKGVDITNTPEAQKISLGALFDGIYTVGRVDKSTDKGATIAPPTIKATTPLDPYKGFNGGILFDLTANSQIESMYPIVKSSYGFLTQFGALETFSQKDDIDYEEVDMSSFELYKKLGSGFAQTAMVKEVTGERVVIKPTPSDHPLYTAEIGEGIYTTASNLKTDYRILASGYADDTIMGKRPTKQDFLKESVSKISVLFAGDAENTPIAHAVYKLDDDVMKKYLFKVNIKEALDVVTLEELKANLDKEAPVKPLAEVTSVTVGKYVIAEAENSFWVVTGETDAKAIMPVAALTDDTLDFVVTASEKNDVTTFEINVLKDYADFTTISEFIETLKTSVIGRLFNIVCDNKYANELIAATPVDHTEATENKKIEVALNIAIPYTTSDNFARQLAQHCEYTSLKTYQTHGVIGVKPITDTSIKAVTEKCNQLIEKDYDLYVKNAVGRQVLDINNMPYHIGKAITITTIQHSINTLDGYSFTSSGQGAYVGRASVLDTSVSTTNQVVPVSPHFTYGETQKAALNKKGYVTIGYKDGVYKITDGVTQAPIYSQFSRFATFRTMKLVDRVIREATEPFIGKKNNLINRNAMYTAIKSGMDGLLDIYLERYEFNMNYNKHDARLGEIKIAYDIDIVDEIRNVKNTVTAKKSE